MEILSSITHHLELIRKHKPLILNVTNFVTMDFIANALLALGASPIVSMEPSEMEELVQAADAVAINMGTLEPQWRKAAEAAWNFAEQRGKPVIFDPVGAGATRLRTHTAEDLLKRYSADIVRGNASEILSLCSEMRTGKGVDGGILSEEEILSLHSVLSSEKRTFVLSGPTDFIFSEGEVHRIENGHHRMSQVTGMGCASTAILAAFRAVCPDFARAARDGVTFVGLCGEKAAEQSNGPGSLRTHFLDRLCGDVPSLPVRVRST